MSMVRPVQRRREQPFSRPERNGVSAIVSAGVEAVVCLPAGRHHRGDAAPVIPDGAALQFRCAAEAESGLAALSVERDFKVPTPETLCRGIARGRCLCREARELACEGI